MTLRSMAGLIPSPGARHRAGSGVVAAEHCVALDPRNLRQVFFADTLWGCSGALDQHRALAAPGGLEKGTGYYLQNHVFLTKMGLLRLILGLGVRPMLALMRWRRAAGGGPAANTAAAGT